ncbi:hypothetical protein ACQ4PT_000429 [Festuca glaucescens]
MDLCLGKTSPCPRPDVTPKIAGGCLCPKDPATWSWPDLPPEITGLVLSRLPSHDDRLSFAAVCHDWRLATQHQRAMLPPAIPCINLGNGVYHGLADGKARRFATFRGSYIANASFGSWLLYYDQRRGSGQCLLRAHNSPAIKVPCLYVQRALLGATSSIADTLDMGTNVKMVVCSSHLIVAIFRSHTFGDILPSSGVDVTLLVSGRPGPGSCGRLYGHLSRLMIITAAQAISTWTYSSSRGRYSLSPPWRSSSAMTFSPMTERTSSALVIVSSIMQQRSDHPGLTAPTWSFHPTSKS